MCHSPGCCGELTLTKKHNVLCRCAQWCLFVAVVSDVCHQMFLLLLHNYRLLLEPLSFATNAKMIIVVISFMRAVSGRKRLHSIQNTFRWMILKAHSLQKSMLFPRVIETSCPFLKNLQLCKKQYIQYTVLIKQLGYQRKLDGQSRQDVEFNNNNNNNLNCVLIFLQSEVYFWWSVHSMTLQMSSKIFLFVNKNVLFS